MRHPVASRRTQLLARSALCGVLGALAIGASAAAAQVTGVGTITSTTSNGGAVGVASGGGVTDITTNAGRSIVNWADLTVTPTEALNFYFNNRSDIVVNRVAGAASIDGILNGCMPGCAINGGNIWILSTGGVLIGADAQINTGGFLASTGSLTDGDILDGDMNFAFTGAPANSTISVAGGASLNTDGGSLALIAPIVTTAAGSTVRATDGGNVIYGSAENYNVTFAPTGTDDLDLLTFQVPSQSDGSGGTPGLILNGTTSANQVFAAVVSKVGVASSILLGGDITATTASGEDGDIVLSAGAGFTNGVADTPMGFDGSITQNTTSTLTGANITMRASNNIVADEISASGGVSLNSEWGSISQTGAITANVLSAEAGGDVILTNAGNDFNALGYIESQGLVGIDIVDADGFVVGNYIFHLGGGARTASLTALTGSITQTGGIIQVGTLNVSAAGGSINFGTAGNNTANLGTITAGAGDFSYRSILDVNVAGVITASNVTLSSLAGQITTSGGAIVTSRLTASASGAIGLDGTFSELGAVTAGGNILLATYSGGLDLTGDVSGQTVSLYVDGELTQSGGRIDAARLNVITSGAISLTGANEIDVVGRLDADRFDLGTGADITLRNVGNIVLDYLVEAPGGTVTFTSDTGAITQTSFGAITADSLVASAAGTIEIYNGVNDVATIGGLSSTGGDIVYRDVDSFDIQGDITADSTVNRGVMLVAGGAGGGISQLSGVLDVGYFRGIANGSITLGGANQIRRLISTVIGGGGNLTLNTTTNLSVDGTVSANTVSLTSAAAITQATNAQIWTNTLNASAVTGVDLTASGFGANNIGALGTITNTTSGGVTLSNAMNFNLTGNITASGQAVSITNTQGSISQTGGIITADTLSLSATTGITANGANVVGSLGAVTAGGNFAFTNIGDLYLSGNIDAGANTVSLTSNTGQIEQTFGVITANSLNLQTGGRIWLNNANAVTSLGTVTAGGHILFRNEGNTVVGGDITASGFDVTLRSNAGSVTQTAGSDITSNSLQVIAATGATLTNAGNAINQLAWADTASGGFAFRQTGGFQIVGPVLAGGQTVSLTSLTGAITQTSGSVLQAGLLNANAVGTLTLNEGNNVTSLGVISTGGSFLFRDVDGFDLTGNITAASQVVMLAQGGSITQTGGIITSNEINALATVDILLGGANQINAIGSLVAGNDLLYRQVGDLAAPTISATGTVSLYSTTGDITQTGTITADTLVLGAADDITLGQNFVTKLGQIDAGGDFTAADANGLSLGALGLTGNITVGGAMTLVNPGAIFQTSSTGITAGSLFIDTDGALGATGANSISGNTRLSATGVAFNAVGDLTVQVNVTGFATIVSDGAVVFDGVGASTGDTLNVEAVNGISQGAAGLNFTNFGYLTNATAGGIDLTNSSWLTLTGAISALGQDVTLNVATGGIIQSSGSTITANRLSVTATQGAQLGELNQVAELGVIDAGAHNFVFRTMGDLLIDGDLTSAINVILTSATGGISQTAGSDITAGGLSVWAETGINLTSTGNSATRILNLMNLGSGGIDYRQANGILIDGTIRALNQTVSLTSANGGISETNNIFFPQIEAGTLHLSAAGAITLHRDNDVNNLGVVSAVGGFTFNDVDGFNLTGNVNGGGAVVLDAVNGSIVQSGGVINATSIDAAASGDLDLASANVVTAVTALSAGNNLLYRQVGDLSVPAISVAGSLSLYSTTGSITQTGALGAATFNAGAATGIALTDIGNTFAALGNLTNVTSGGITVYDADDINLTGAISTSAAQSVTLAAVSGAITQQTGATVETGALTLGATAGATLDGDNDVDALGTISVGPSFSFNDVDGFDIAGDLSATTANLTSGGAITQSTGVLGVGTLSLTGASATLDGANDIDTLGDVDVTGDMSFHDIGDINLNGDQTVGGTLSLTSGAIIRQLGSGVLDAGRFEAGADGGVLLGNSGNAVASLGDISTTSGAIYITTASPLTIDGDLTATGAGGAVTVQFGGGGVAMTTSASITTGGNVQLIGAGDIVLGAITADRLSTVSHSGTISSTAAPTIVANRLTGSAAGGFVLTGSNIDINEFAFNAANEISLTGNNGPLDLIGQVAAQTVTLGSTGAITQSAGLVRAAVATLSGGGIVANQANDVQTVNLNGASISFTNADSFAANVITSTGAVSLTSNTGAITQTASTGRIVADSLTASAATGLEFFGGQNDIRLLAGLSSASGGVTWRDMGGFEITGNIDATGQTVELVSDGTGADGTDVTQSGGVITASRLQGTSAGDLLFTSANVVGQLGYLNAGGNIRYRGAASFTLQDNVNAGGGVILNADTGSIQQFGGAIVADAFAGTAAQGISLTRVNDIDFLGAVDSGAGDFNFRDLDSFDIAGLITSDNGVMLQAGGNITESSGSLVTGTLSLFVSGTAVVNGSGNDIDFLGESTGMNALAFTDIDGFDISGRVFSSGAISLTATTGDVAEVAGGYLSANGLSVYASNGEIDLAGDNSIENVGDLVAGGDVTFHDTDGFLTFGNIAGDAVRLTTADGGISQMNGAIGANTLLVSAYTGIDLSQAGNDVGAIAGMTNATSGGITYTDANSVNIAGAVTADGQTVTFNVGTDLTQSVTGVITAATVAGSAGGAFALADAANVVAQLGPVTAASIDLVTVNTGLTIVGALNAASGVTLKADDFITQSIGATITGATLRAQADGDIILGEANDLDSITLLYSDLGDITWNDVDGFSLDGSSLGDFWSSGTFTLTAGGAGDITQSGVGLRAGTLLVSAGGDVTLDQDNRIDVLGDSSAGGPVFQVVNLGDLEVAGGISVAGASGGVDLTSRTGKVEQTSGEIDAYTVGGASAGDFILTHFTGALGDIATTAGDIDISNAGDIVLFGTLHTDNADSVTLTSTGGGIGHGVGRIETGTLNLDAAIAIALDGAQSNDVERLGTVTTYSNFAFRNDDSFELTGDIDVSMTGGGVVLTSDSGGVIQTGGAVTAYDLTLQTTGGMDLSGANRVDRLTVNNSSTAGVGFVNARALDVLGVTSSGGVDLQTTAGLLTVSGGVTTSGEIRLAGAGGVLATGSLGTIGDLTVTAAAGDIALYDVWVGDDLMVTATDGDAQVRNLTLTGSSDGETDGGNALIFASGDAFLGARGEAVIGGETVNRAGGVGEIVVASTGDGDAGVFLQNAYAQIDLSAGADGTATYVLGSGDLQAGNVSGTNVVLKANAGAVNAGLVILGGGDYVLYGQDFSVGAFGFIGAARDITITDTSGLLELTGSLFANRNLTITAVGSVLDGTGAVSLLAGLDADDTGVLTVTAASISLAGAGADGDVTLTATSGNVDVATVGVSGDYTLSGAGFSTGALSPIGATSGTWFLTATGGFDFTGLMLTYNGDIEIQANDAITGGDVQSITGSVSIDGPDDIDVEGLYAAADITVDSSANLTLDSATSYGGDITLTGGSVTVEGFAEAGGQVLVSASNGGAAVNAAAAGGNITVQSTNGDAILAAAALTGPTGDLLVSAQSGDVVFGVLDYSTISSDNVFSRAAGGVGTATLISTSGDVTANLWTSARLDLVQASIDAEVSAETGGLEIGQLQSTGGEVYAEAVDGDLTVGDAYAVTGFLGLYAGGDLTILNSAYGQAGVEVETGGLLDGALASTIFSGGDMALTGGSVLLNRVAADRDLSIAATGAGGDVHVGFAETDSFLVVGSLDGAATLGGAQAADGIQLFGFGTVTLGAESSALITNQNAVSVSGGGCGCGPGDITVISQTGDARVNLDVAFGVFDAIGAAIDGDVDVAILNGNLTIADLAGYNITVDVRSGTLETGYGDPGAYGVFLSGGDYSVAANGFLGNALTPNLPFGTMNDYIVIKRGGVLDMTGVVVTAQGDILVSNTSGGVTGDAQLIADGDITIAANGIAVDTVEAGGDLALEAGNGNVIVATSVTVGGDYALTGADFSAATLNPFGARAGDLRITDTVGDFDYSAATLTWGGDITISATDGTVLGGDITSASGNIEIQANGIDVGVLSAVDGQIAAYAYGGPGANVASATALDDIDIYTSAGNAILGAATLLGTGTNTLLVNAGGYGSAIFGGAMAGGITGANSFTSNGSTTLASVQAAGGSAYVNLDTSDAITGVTAVSGHIGIVVRSGDFELGSAYTTGEIDIEGPDGRLAVGSLTADGDIDIHGADITLTHVDTTGNLFVTASGDLTFNGPDGVHPGRIAVDNWIVLEAGGDVTQSADASFSAIRLTVDAKDISLLGLNQVETIGNVSGDSFAYRSVRAGGFDIGGGIDVGGGTVELIAENGGITQGSSYTIFAGSLTGASQGGADFAGDNYIDALDDLDNTGGAFFLNVPQALTIVGAVESDSAVVIQTTDGGMTIASSGTVRSTAAGDAVVLASDGVFTNHSGADGVQASNGRWLIYSQAAGDPEGSTAGNDFGGLDGRSWYNSAYDFGAAAFAAAPNAGNRFVYGYQPTLTVTPVSQRITYNGQIPTLGALIAGFINGDAAADAWSGAPTISGADSKNVGTYGLYAALGSLASDMNYAFLFGAGTLIIDPKTLAGTVMADNKVYDGATDATGVIGLDGVVAGDAVVATATGFQFADRNAGLGKIVTAMGAALSGADAGNYTLGSVGAAVADILRRSLTGVLTANNKTYDGTTAATGSIGLTGVVAGDTVAATATSFSFADRNAGVGKVVTANGAVLSGADAGNYDLGPISGVADILRRSIGGTVVASNKIYDGSTAATGTINLTGVVAGDDIRAGGSLAFDDRNAGVGLIVSAANTALSGADAGNYTLTGVANGIADILRRAINVQAHDQSKRFGQTDPSLTYGIGGAGLVQGDVLTGGLARAAGENAGVYAIGQGDLAASSNYILTFTPGEFVIQIPPVGGIQSLQTVRSLGETSTFALDRDPGPGLIAGEVEDERDPEDRTRAMSE